MKRINRCQIIFFLCILNAVYCSAQFTIRGKCLDGKEAPVQSVNVVITAVTNTNHIVKGTTTNGMGDFSCANIPEGDYMLHFSMVGYQNQKSNFHLNKNIDLGTFVLKEDIALLSEVVVTATMLKSYGNKDEIFLKKKNLKIGTNALDAISSLPQFKKNFMSDELETVNRKSLLILIDGKRSSAKELSILQTSDIKKLNFYSDPPARYAHESIGAVLDVIIRRRKEKQYSLYLNTKNSFTTGYGTDVASIMYSDSLNRLSAAYFIDYRALNDNRMNNTYLYENSGNYYKGLPGTYNGRYHIGQLTYQRYQGNNLFNAKLEYRKSPGKEKYSQQVLANNTEKEFVGTNNKNLRSDYDAWSLDLYFMKNFTDTRSLSINAVNTYYTSYSDNVLFRVINNEPSMNYSYENHFKNKSYSFIAEVVYSDKLWKGDWNIGAYFLYKNLHQTFNFNDKSNLNYRTKYVYTDYSNQWKKLSYTLGVAIDNTDYHTVSNDSYNYWVMRPSVSLNYQWNKIISFRLNSSIKSKIPDIGYLTNNIVSIDEHYFSKGNTTLKPYYYYNNELKFQIVSRDNKFYFSPAFFYNYYIHPNAPLLLKDSETIIKQYTKLDNMSEIGYSVTASWNPVQWITFQPYYQYSYQDYRTPNNQVRHSVHNTGISLQFVLKDIQFMWNGNLPFTNVDGDIYNKVGGNMSSSVLWKHKSVSLGAEWIYNPHPSRIYASIDGFQFMEETLWNDFKSLVDVKFTYYLLKGKSRKHISKKINNSDTDSGLTKSNTAK